MSTKKEKPKGFTCTCGEVVTFPMYVYAHWYDELVYTCSKCNKRYSIIEGSAAPYDE